MRIINLDASNWTSVLEFYRGIFEVLQSPEWHGFSINALIDSMVWGGINGVEPPYTIYIRNVKNIPKDILDEIELLRTCIKEARLEYIKRDGVDMDVNLEIVSLN